MKIALVTAQSAGGIGRHVASLVPELVGRGHRVALFAPEETRRFGASESGAEFITFEISPGLRPIRDLFVARRLGQLTRGYDLIHAHGIRAGFVGALAARGRRKCVVTIHNRVFEGGLTRRFAAALVDLVIARLSDARIFVSADLEASSSRGGKTLVLPAVPKSGKRQGGHVADLGVGAGRLTLFSAGRLHRQKGFDVLIEAMANPDMPSNALLLLAGMGPEHANLTARIAELGLEEKVRLLGDRDDVDRLLRMCDVFVMSSRWEGSPLALREAMEAGVPIVATNVGGIPDMVEDGVSALLVPGEDSRKLASAISRIASDSDLRTRLADGSAKAARGLPSAEEIAAAVGDLYEEIAS